MRRNIETGNRIRQAYRAGVFGAASQGPVKAMTANITAAG
jgi:hypothetical protein